jgi:hypothetical protein
MDGRAANPVLAQQTLDVIRRPFHLNEDQNFPFLRLSI